jgi:hypothetical protein
MRKLTIRITIALLTFLLGITATLVFLQPRQPLRIEIPPKWEMYGLEILDKRANEARLPMLRTVTLPDEDLEVRAWVGFGTSGEDGLILRRSGGRWSALHLHGIFERYPPEKYQETFYLAAPKSGWEKTWQRLIEAGILALPDESKLQCGPALVDGVGYAVEINMNRTYRLYSYSNPQYAKCDEAKQMIKIWEIIAEEFSWAEFHDKK